MRLSNTGISSRKKKGINDIYELSEKILNLIILNNSKLRFIQYGSDYYYDFVDACTGEQRRFIIHENCRLSVSVINLQAKNREWKKEFFAFIYERNEEWIRGDESHISQGNLEFQLREIIGNCKKELIDKKTDSFYSGKIKIKNNGKRPGRYAAVARSYEIMKSHISVIP